LAALGVKVAALVILLGTAVAVDDIVLRLLLALAACAAAISAAVSVVTIYGRFANRNATPS
jgi:short subunit fatty acids transporter